VTLVFGIKGACFSRKRQNGSAPMFIFRI